MLGGAPSAWRLGEILGVEMASIVRLFETGEAAAAASEGLAAAGFRASDILVISAAVEDRAQAVRDAIGSGFLRSGSLEDCCLGALERGLSVVSVKAQFGQGQRATWALHAHGPVEAASIPVYESDQPAPLSDLLGMPVLSTHSRAGAGLADSNFSLSRLFGMRLLSRNGRLWFGMKALSSSQRAKRRSFGLPLLSSNAAPLSKLLMWKTLSANKGRWTSSFGLPLLSSNPTPLSSLLGMAPLTKENASKSG